MMPRIGILPDLDGNPLRVTLSPAYGRAVLALGGLPYVLPPAVDSPSSARLARILDELHGILIPGSRYDVEPRRFGAQPEPDLGPVSPHRDRSDWTWLDLAVRCRIPILAVCYGCQVLNVFLGGTLHQHVPGHKPDLPPDAPAHPVTFSPRTRRLRRLRRRTFQVNSSHHQAVERLGSSLVPIAYADDGLVEAYESEQGAAWMVGVQWHPETIWTRDEASRAVFQSFLRAARRYRKHLASSERISP